MIKIQRRVSVADVDMMGDASSKASSGFVQDMAAIGANTLCHQDGAVTIQDLQDMKQMIKAIRERPELLYEYCPIFSQYNERQSRATAAAAIVNPSSKGSGINPG